MATITQRISLEGADDIKKQLGDIGKAGEAALGQIGKAADDVALDQLGKDSEAAAESLDKLAEASQQSSEGLDKTSEAASKTSLETAKLVAEIAKLSTEIAQNSIAIAETVAGFVLLVKVHQSVVGTITKLVTTVTTGVRALGLLAPVLGPVAIALGATGAVAAGAAIGLEAAGAAATAAASPYEKLNHELKMLSESSGQSFEDLQQGEALFGQLGLSAETFRGTISKLAAELKDLDVGESLKKSADAITAANDKAVAAERAFIAAFQPASASIAAALTDPFLSGGAALDDYGKKLAETKKLEQELADARKAATEAAANSLSKVLELVKAVEQGEKGIKFDSMIKADTIIKAVAVSLKQAEENGQNAGKVLIDFIAAAGRVQAVEVGKKFGLSAEDVDRVQRLGGHLATVDEIWKRIQDAGVLIPPGSAQALEQMRTQTQETERAWTRLQQAWQSSIFATVGAKIVSVIESIKQGFINATAAVVEAVNKFLTVPGAFAAIMAGIATVVAIFGGPLLIAIGAVSTALVTLIAYWPQISAAADQAWAAIKQGAADVEAFLDSWVGTPVGNAWQWITDTFWSAVSGLQSAMDTVTGWIRDWVTTPIGNAWQWIQDTFWAVVRSLTGGGSGGASVPGKASGGLIGGRGTGTSDSNLIWVSRGEHIMPARAVAQPGVLAFLEALRRSGGDLSGVLDRLGRFATGGLVTMPALAGGGGVGSMSHVTIQFPGLDPVSGLRATSDVIEQLRRSAAMAQVRSGGRKPSRYT